MRAGLAERDADLLGERLTDRLRTGLFTRDPEEPSFNSFCNTWSSLREFRFVVHACPVLETYFYNPTN